MEAEEGNPSTASAVEPSVVGDIVMPDALVAEAPVSAQPMAGAPVSMVLPVVPPVLPAVVPPPVPPAVTPLSALPAIVPPIAPLPMVPPTIPRPVAPLPIRPPVLKPPVTKNGEVGVSDSESDDDDDAEGASVEYEISEESRQVRERHEKAVRDLMMKRRAAALAVPTNDMAVRSRLRRLGEPITLFGEREMERRDRLRMLMAKLDAEGQLEKLMKAHEEEEETGSSKRDDDEEEIHEYPFYTEGSNELLRARAYIAEYSIRRAAQRLQRARRRRDDADEDEDAEVDEALNKAKTLVLDSSEIGDDRPLCGCSISNDGAFLATWYVLELPILPPLIPGRPSVHNLVL